MCFVFTAIPMKRSQEHGRRCEEQDSFDCDATMGGARMRLPQAKGTKSRRDSTRQTSQVFTSISLIKPLQVPDCTFEGPAIHCG